LAGLGVEAALTDWVRMYQDLLVELGTLATDRDLSRVHIFLHLLVPSGKGFIPGWV